MGKKIKVLVVDDSAIVRKLLTEQLSRDHEIEVVGTAMDPYIARDKILELKPDVVTLDIEMPRMDGLTFLKILMKHHPLPIIILSSLTQAGSHFAMQALQLGAIDVLGKPNGSSSVGDVGIQLVEKVKGAASARMRNLPHQVEAPSSAASETSASARTSIPSKVAPAPSVAMQTAPPSPMRTASASVPFHPRQLLLLGASTGGTEALKEVLIRLPKEVPGICIVQHIPPYFSKAFADRLNTLCDIDVREAVDGDIVTSGLALIAPGDFHMVLRWNGRQYRVELNKAPQVWHQRPAVDILFKSAVEAGAAPYSVCGLLTGMGRDGAEGLLQLRQNKALTYAQNEETCVVFGMPRAAMELNAADQMLPLLDFPQALTTGAYRLARRPPTVGAAPSPSSGSENRS